MSFGNGFGKGFGNGSVDGFGDGCGGAIFDDACEFFCSIAVTSCTNIIIVGSDLDGNLMQFFEYK